MLRRDRNFVIEMSAGLSASAIQYIESTRAKDDIALEFDFRYRWQEGVQTASDRFAAGAIAWEQSRAQWPAIARSRWLQLLAEMRWTEVEIFEISTIPFQQFERVPAVTNRTRQAEEAFRSGDWNGVLANSRAALEAAAKAQSKSDNLKSGFELLLSVALPESAEKREIINSLVKFLSDYAHLGRHEHFPALNRWH
jgi:hypothetical protein